MIADRQTPGTLYALAAVAVYTRAGNSAWSIRKEGLPPGFSAMFLSMDPQDSSTLYTGGAAGVFRSINHGDTWTALDGVGIVNPSGLAADPCDRNHLFVWSSSSFAESANGGASWTPVAGLSSGSSLVFDASASGRVYARGYDGVKRSADGGRTWAQLASADGLVDSSLLVVTPDGHTLYAGGPNAGVWTFHLDRRRAAGH